MLQNWLTPSKVSNKGYTSYQIGAHIKTYQTGQAGIEQAHLALIGLGTEDADAVRQALYPLAYNFRGLQVSDLGNARRTEPDFLIQLIKELLDSQLLPVLIGNEPQQALAQYKAFQELQYLINLIAVDERIAFHPEEPPSERNYLAEVLNSPKSQLFHLNFIGSQAHFVPPALFHYLDERHFDYTRLGQARRDISELEPPIRDGDLMSFQLSAVRAADAPGQCRPSPSGFAGEEACQICRYAGMSDKMKAFGIYGFRTANDRQGLTAQLAAQMLWYFIDGFFHRKQDFPASMQGLSEYIVDFKGLEYQLTFWRSEKSSRWWMQVPVRTDHAYQRHRLVPCSYNDYLMACQDQLPERLLRALQRFN